MSGQFHSTQRCSCRYDFSHLMTYKLWYRLSKIDMEILEEKMPVCCIHEFRVFFDPRQLKPLPNGNSKAPTLYQAMLVSVDGCILPLVGQTIWDIVLLASPKSVSIRPPKRLRCPSRRSCSNLDILSGHNNIPLLLTLPHTCATKLHSRNSKPCLQRRRDSRTRLFHTF